MKQQNLITRRTFGKIATAATGALWATAVLGAGRAKVVIIGGGPGGISVARSLATH